MKWRREVLKPQRTESCPKMALTGDMGSLSRRKDRVDAPDGR